MYDIVQSIAFSWW